jgi:hypothetical protein
VPVLSQVTGPKSTRGVSNLLLWERALFQRANPNPNLSVAILDALLPASHHCAARPLAGNQRGFPVAAVSSHLESTHEATNQRAHDSLQAVSRDPLRRSIARAYPAAVPCEQRLLHCTTAVNLKNKGPGINWGPLQQLHTQTSVARPHWPLGAFLVVVVGVSERERARPAGPGHPPTVS